jgi:hypothetical protein
MSRQYNVLREASRNERTTIADAIDVLETEANFKPDDCATVWLQPLQLQSATVAWLVSVIFDGPDAAVGFVVPLRTAKAFSAIDMDGFRKRLFQIESLDGATTDASGVVSLANGDKVRALELISAQLPRELSPLDEKIIHLAISMIKGAEGRCYRDLRDDLPAAERSGIPSLRFLDFSKLAEGPDRPALKVPYLKVIRGKFEETYPHDVSPSEQAIADALEKAGMRVPRRRPKAA